MIELTENPISKPPDRMELVSILYNTTLGECEVKSAILFVNNMQITPFCYVGHRCARSCNPEPFREFYKQYPNASKLPAIIINGNASDYWIASDDGFPLYPID